MSTTPLTPSLQKDPTRWLFGVALLLSSCATPAPPPLPAVKPCIPQLMVKMVLTKSVPRGMKWFAPGPEVVLYRYGDRYLREEDSNFESTHRRRVKITSGSDVWVFDPATRAGEHFVVHNDLPLELPILEVRSGFWYLLQFGCEEQFFRDRHIGQQPATGGAHAYQFDTESFSLRAFIGEDNRPMRIEVSKHTRYQYAIHYLEYHWLEPDLSLFQPSADIAITEAPPGKPPE